MTNAIDTSRADSWGFNPMNYKLSYCNAGDLVPDDHYVDTRQDQGTGLVYFDLYPVGVVEEAPAPPAEDQTADPPVSE